MSRAIRTVGLPSARGASLSRSGPFVPGSGLTKARPARARAQQLASVLTLLSPWAVPTSAPAPFLREPPAHPGSGGLLPAPPSAFSLSSSCSVFLTALITHWHGFWPVYVSPCYLWNVNSTRTEAIRELWFPVASCGARHGAWPIGRWSESPPRDSVTGWVSGSVRAFLSLGPTVSRPGAGSRSFPSRRIQRDYMSFLSLP